VAKTICLTESVPLAAALALALALALAELEPELELEHPAVPSRPATTVTPSQVAVRMLKMFIKAICMRPE
jgi:hypothetical protein